MTIVSSHLWESERSGVWTKRCQTCHQDKPRDQFYRNRHYADGLMKACKACQAVQACTTCHLVKPLEEFYKQRLASDGHHSLCKLCSQQKQKAFRAAHPEYMRQRDAHFRHAYAAKIPARRARWPKAHPGKSQEYEAKR